MDQQMKAIMMNCFHETFLSGKLEIDRFFFFSGHLGNSWIEFLLKDSQHTLYVVSWNFNITGTLSNLTRKLRFKLTVNNVISIGFV